jgi:hypothetical protein
MNFDFTQVLEKIGFLYAKELKDNIRKQLGIDGAGYNSVFRRIKAHSTKGHQRSSKLGKSYQVGAHQVRGYTQQGRRLVNTGRFNQDAFVYETTPNTLTVEANPAGYDGRVTFSDIVAFNDRDSGEIRGNRQAVSPKLFPRTEPEFLATETGGEIQTLIEADVERQKPDLEAELQAIIGKEVRIITG